MNVAVAGDEDDVLGFGLAGVRRADETPAPVADETSALLVVSDTDTLLIVSASMERSARLQPGDGGLKPAATFLSER